jgi:anaphase-promoting complex subunit 1
LDQIAYLSTSCGPQFWDIELDFSKDELRQAFSQTQSIYLQRRPPREGAFTSTLRTLGNDRKGDNPLDWIFGLEKLRGVSYAERAALLESNEKEQEEGSAIDAGMEMERGIVEGGDRERLEGARLLFEWGAARERLLQHTKPGVHNSQATIKPGDTEEDSVIGENMATHDSGDNVWWIKDSAIETLKGRVWLAAREGEQ